ncbi:FAD-dependent oxidoreductase [Pseudonocardia tropica]|uniref:FAD-dependent oxidoreductase n=1 Tax=Pseudonocardia tropica TaxID=681289 RepID=A0ABV1JXR6_9PSEU
MRKEQQSYDVVVCGGGLAGFSAAVASARHGARTCLVQNRPVLGGNSSSEIRVTPHGAAAFHGYARETGIIGEALCEERARNHEPITENGWTNSVWDLVLYDIAVRTPNLTLHLNSSVHGVDMAAPDRIGGVRVRVENAEVDIQVTGRTFIDCTGDGTVAALAGSDWRTGTEARSEFDEPHAPATASAGVMGSSLHFKTVDVGHPVPFAAPDWAVRYDDPSFFHRGGRVPKTLRSGYWWIEIGPPWDTLHDNEAIRHELTRHVLGIWDYIKNRDPQLSSQAANLALDWVGQVPGKRESRRIVGQHLLTENDLIDRTVFDDEVAFGGWYVDLHTLGGLLADTSEPLNAQELDPTSDYGAKTNVGPFGIPLRIMLDGTVQNLLLAGRNVSATHAGMGSIRVMSTCAVMGQAAGTAAALAVAEDAPAADIPITLVGDVQQALLRDGCFLPNVANDDPLDLARRATISASSSDTLHAAAPGDPDGLGGLGHWTDHPVFPVAGRLERRCAQWIALGAEPRLDSVALYLSNDSDDPQTVELELHAVDDIWDYRVHPGTPLAKTSIEVPPGVAGGWVVWDLRLGGDELEPRSYVRVTAAPNPHVEWHPAGSVQPGHIATYEAAPGLYRRFGGGTTLSFRVEPPQQVYGPENLVTGVTRPHRHTNLWRSAPGREMPQSLELRWDRPQEIRQVQLTFAGHLLREYHAQPPFFRDPQCVRDYTIEARTNGAWRPLVEVTDNLTTRVVHDLDEAVVTDRLRLVVRATNGDPAAGVYEIRCYSAAPCTPVSFPPAATPGGAS